MSKKAKEMEKTQTDWNNHHKQSLFLIKQINPDELAIVNICLVSSGMEYLWTKRY